MQSLLRDVRYGLRTLKKSPGITFAAILALALGIGANTAIFSVVNAIVFRPLPYKNPEQLVLLAYAGHEASPANYLDWQSQNTVFQDMVALQYWNANLTDGAEPERVQGFAVTPNLFPMLGVQPERGRIFSAEEAEVGKGDVLMISHELWQRRYGGDPNIVGKPILINNRPWTLVGIMPPNFQFYRQRDLWIPLPFDDEDRKMRRANFLIAAARLKDGVSLQQAQADMTNISRRLEQQYPDTNTGTTVTLLPLHESIVGNVRPALLILLAAVAFVLLIACANVANLLLARAATRQKEIALRMALGAGRGRLIRQLLTESVVLSVVGGAIGLLLSYWGVRSLVSRAIESGSPLPRLQEVGIDSSVMLFTLVVSVLTGLIFGLAPALQFSRPNLQETLKEGGRGASSGGSGRFLRNLLVVGEFVLSLVLLIGASLLIKSFIRLLDVDPGFDPKNVLTMQIGLSPGKYPENPQVASTYQQLLERIKATPGVQYVGAGSEIPLDGSDRSGAIAIEGRPPAAPNEMPVAHLRTVTPDYFRALNIPLLKGRFFSEQDVASAPGVAIISQEMARKNWPNEDPVGKRIRNTVPAGAPEPPWMTVVGVVADVRHAALNSAPAPHVYVPHAQSPVRSMTLLVRSATAGDPQNLSPAVRAQIQGMDKGQPVYNIKTMEKVVSDSVALSRFAMVLLGIFAGVALVLATVGVYGVMAYSVTQRTHEIGIRMALGAKPGDILKLVLKQGLLMALIGVVVGLGAAFVVTRVMASLLFGVSAVDPATFVLVPLVLTVTALAASYIPARRATKVDPLIALRFQ